MAGHHAKGRTHSYATTVAAMGFALARDARIMRLERGSSHTFDVGHLRPREEICSIPRKFQLLLLYEWTYDED